MSFRSPQPTPLFAKSDPASHMPFLRDGTLLFCRAGEPERHTFVSEGTLWQRVARDPKMRARFAGVAREQVLAFRRWKIWKMAWPGGKATRLTTGLPEDAVECCPTFYEKDGTYHVSFIGGIPTSRCIEYSLYTLSGPSLDELSPALPIVRGVRAGFASNRFLCASFGPQIELLDRHTGEQLFLSVPDRSIAVSYRADMDTVLIVTRQFPQGETNAIFYDLASEEESSVVRGPVYKPTVCNGDLIYSQQRGSRAESYELCQAPVQLASVANQSIRRNAEGRRRLESLVLSGAI